MRTVRAMIGVSINVNGMEYEQWKRRVKESGGELHLTDREVERFFMRGFVDGDSYVPADGFERSA